MGGTALMVASLAATAISTGIGVMSSIQQGKIQQANAEAQQQAAIANAQAQVNAQQAQADAARAQAESAAQQSEYQRRIAERNAQAAEAQASYERRQGYEDAQAKRLQAARLIGQQRARAGASGAAVDMGSFEDVAEDSASAGEFDALNAYNQAIDKAYNTEIQAWNYRNTAGGYGLQTESYHQQANLVQDASPVYIASPVSSSSASTLSAIGQGIGGIAQMGTTWAKFNDTPASGPQFTSNYNKMNLGKFSY